MGRSLKIRVYSPFYPFPVSEGAFQVIADQVRYLAEQGPLELVVWKETKYSLEKKRACAPLPPGVSLIHWEAVDTERLWGRAKRVFCAIAGGSAGPELFYYPPNQDRRDELGPVDLAIYHYSFAAAWNKRGKAVCERRRAVHLHNIESDLSMLRASKAGIFTRWIHRLNTAALLQSERHLAKFFDELWFLSPKDLEDWPHKKTEGMKLRPPTYDEQLIVRRSRAFRDDGNPEETVLGFIGGLSYEPNRTSMEWILREVCPRLAAGGFCGRLLVVGQQPPLSLLRMAESFPFIKFLGFLPELEDFWRTLSLMMVPHQAGSGVRIKLLDALASGVPVLCNGRAAERLHPELRSSPLLTVHDDPEEWAKMLLELKGRHLRRSHDGRPLDEALRGERIYADLSRRRIPESRK